MWLSVKIVNFGLSTADFFKFALAQLAIIVVINGAGVLLFSTASLILPLSAFVWLVDIIVWVYLLKRYSSTKYSLGKALGAYAVFYVLLSVVSVFLAMIMLATLAQTFRITGDSMAPTYKNNQAYIVYKFDKSPKLGDVIVFKADASSNYLGRVIGTPNQEVKLDSGQVVIDNQAQSMDSVKLGPNQYLTNSENPKFNMPIVVDGDKIIGIIGVKIPVQINN